MNNSELDSFIKKAKAKNLSDEDIKQRLLASGWGENDINAALADDDLVVPLPPTANNPLHKQQAPIAVVQNLSVRGFEYSIMFISLWASAFSIIWLAITYVNDLFSKASGDYVYGSSNSGSAFMITLLLVTFPIFAYMFLRLKRIELTEPDVKSDPSRRKLTQLTQLVSFLIAIGFTVYFIYSIISPDANNSGSSEVVKRFLQTLIAIVVAGGIFLYYWREDRKHLR